MGRSGCQLRGQPSAKGTSSPNLLQSHKFMLKFEWFITLYGTKTPKEERQAFSLLLAPLPCESISQILATSNVSHSLAPSLVIL